MSGPLRTFKTRGPRRKGPGATPVGHVCMQQLKREAEAGVAYFWSRRPEALRPTGDWFFDFKKHRTA